MRNILSGSRGMSPVVLVILIAWALLSVIFLTGTLLAARSIDRSVSGVTNRTGADGKPEKNIKTTVEEIGREGKFIDEARKTVQISTAIRKAAAPLGASLARTEVVAKQGIDPKLKRILGKVNDINEVAGRINSNVVGIHGTVDTIYTSVISIGGSVKSITGDVGTIRTSASQINGSARAILGSLSSVLARTQSIDKRVTTINGQAQTVLGTTGPILEDFHGIRRNVGGAPGHDNTVTGHANGIDCSILLLGSKNCNK
jgi:membrane protein implicated in regulation of membrane protease activity